MCLFETPDVSFNRSIPFPADIQQSDIMQNADVRVLNHYRLQRLKQDKLFRNVHS